MGGRSNDFEVPPRRTRDAIAEASGGAPAASEEHRR
jgi:hypothetical protein